MKANYYLVSIGGDLSSTGMGGVDSRVLIDPKDLKAVRAAIELQGAVSQLATVTAFMGHPSGLSKSGNEHMEMLFANFRKGDLEMRAAYAALPDYFAANNKYVFRTTYAIVRLSD